MHVMLCVCVCAFFPAAFFSSAKPRCCAMSGTRSHSTIADNRDLEPASRLQPGAVGVLMEENPIFSFSVRSRHLGNIYSRRQHLGAGGRSTAAHSARHFNGLLRPEDVAEAEAADTELASRKHFRNRQTQQAPDISIQQGCVDARSSAAVHDEESDHLAPGVSATRSVSHLSSSALTPEEDAHDDVLLRRRRQSTVFGVSSVREHVLTFLTTIECRAAEANSCFRSVQSKIHRFAPRARVYAFAEVELLDRNNLTSAARAKVFSGLIQVVPMYTMKQVSLRRIMPIACLQHVIGTSTYLAFMVAWNVAAAVFYAAAGRLDASVPLLAVSWCVASLQIVFVALWVLHLSRPICKLLLLTYDFWLMVFWVALSSWTRGYHSQARDDKKQYLFANDVSFTVVQGCILFLDAFPSISRRNKGIIYACNAVLHLYTYAEWFVEVYTGSALRTVTVSLFGQSFPLVLLAQTTAMALMAFNVRLVMRCWLKRLDLAVVDFAVNVVPHQVIDTICQLPSDESDADVSEEGSGNFRSRDGSLNAPLRRSETDFIAFSASPKLAETSASLRSFGQSSTSHPDSLRRMARQQRSQDDLERRGSLDKVTTAHPSRDTLVTMHVDGSLPCAENEEEVMLEALRQSVAPDGAVDAHIVEHSCTFSSDRRTFLPVSYMKSYSPLPLIAWPAAYLVLSHRLAPLAALCCMVVVVAVLALFLNSHLHEYLWAHVTVRAVAVAFELSYMLFGMSHALARDAIKTLDFWFVIASFLMQTIATTYVYTHLNAPVVAGAHAVLLMTTAMFLAFIDSVASSILKPHVKGIVGLLMALYAVYTLFFFQEDVVDGGVYYSTIELRITVISPTSMSQISSLSLILLFVKVAARTLWMKSSLVFFQLGAVEEVIGEDGFVDICTHVR